MKFNLSCEGGVCQRDTASGPGPVAGITSGMRAAAVLAAILAVACGDASGPGVLVTLSIEGLAVTDTVRAHPATPVLVTVRDSAGRPVVGDSVFFEGLPPDTFPWAASLSLSLDSGMHFDRYRTGV